MRRRYIADSIVDNLVNFASNDYLGISSHAKVKKAFIAGIEKYGFGSGSSPLIAGYYEATKLAEERFAEFMGRERALFFNSGYHANIGLITAIANRDSIVVADRLVHASIIDGIRLSGCKHHRYRHNDPMHLQEIIEEGSIVITESVFSMEGDISPIAEIAEITRKCNSILIVDDAHGVGEPIDAMAKYIVSPLGKAFGGVGAFISGTADDIETLIQKSRTYIYSTALPPAIACAVTEAINIIATEKWRRERLYELTRYFIAKAKEFGLPLVSNHLSPIKSILTRNFCIKEQMMEKGFYISFIKPPTVAAGAERIRISLNCNHTEKQIEGLLYGINELQK